MGKIKRLKRINRPSLENRDHNFSNEIRSQHKEILQKRKLKRYKLKRHVYVESDLLWTEAFKKLNKSSLWVLLRFLQKRTWSKIGKRKKGKIVYDNDVGAFTYAEAFVLGIKTNAFFEAIKRLVEVGFIDIEHQGGAYGKDYSRYSLSDRWRNYGTPLFKKVEKKRSLQMGMDVQSNIRRKRDREGKSSIGRQKRLGNLRLIED